MKQAHWSPKKSCPYTLEGRGMWQQERTAPSMLRFPNVRKLNRDAADIKHESEREQHTEEALRELLGT